MTLEFSGIGHEYPAGEGKITALRNLNLTVEEGEFVTLLGPSGCGKSTLLAMAAGFIQPTAGTVTVDGVPVSGPGRDRAMVFQTSALMPWLTVSQNIELAYALSGGTGEDDGPAVGSGRSGNFCRAFRQETRLFRKARSERVREVLELVGLRGFDSALPHQLSVGMRQKTAIARSLVLGSRLLLMDEPFASLDEQTRLRLNREVVDLWLRERRTILFVTHSIQEALVLAARIVLMSARPGCAVAEWRLPATGNNGLERQRERIGSKEWMELGVEILEKMELCCPPGSDCRACGCRS